MTKEIAAIAFDLDDTLIKSSIDYWRMKLCIVDIFTQLNLEKSKFNFETPNFKLIEEGLHQLTIQGASDEKLTEVKASISQTISALELESLPAVTALPGAVNVLGELKEKKLKTGVLTRGCREYATLALEKCGMVKLLDGLVARDEVKNPKPHPDQIRTLSAILDVSLQEMILVGDSVVDLLSAQNAKISFVGVLSGLSDKDAFRTHGCQDLIQSITELPKYIEKITLN
ncbi:MAG: HAD family hydrolase [Candidatus Bathyarchaeia archaeon]